MSKQKSLDLSVFDNNIYHDPQRYDDEYWWKKDDIEFWKRIFELSPGNRVLELAAGTGRLAIPLIREGAKYTGIEISPEFCNQAKVKLKQNHQIGRIIEGDIRNFDLKETFDLVFIGFNSFLHLLKNEDAASGLRCAKKHMHKNSLFIIDIFVPNPLFLYRPKIRYPIMEYTDSITKEITQVEEISVYNPNTEVNEITWFYSTPNQRDNCVYSFTMRMYFPDTMNRMLIDAGLSIQHLWGSHDMAEFSEESVLQIYSCQL